MIKHLTPIDILAMSHVDRWHTLRTARTQNLAEHSYRVAVLAVWMGRQREPGLEPFTPEVELQVLHLGLTHDSPEIEFGDVPSPTKGMLGTLTGVAYDRVMDKQFWWSRGAEASPWDTVSPLAKRLVIVADALDAACFYWAEGLTRARPGQVDLPEAIVREAWAAVDRELPDLEEAVAQVMLAAGVPESLAYRFDPSKA